MIKTKANSSRSELKFVQLVKNEFSFLEKDYDYRISEVRGNTWIRYESDIVFLQIYHGRASYEVGVELGLLTSGQEEIPYLIEEILQLKIGNEARNSLFQGETRTALENIMPVLVLELRSYCVEILNGKVQIFEILDLQRKRNSEKLNDVWIREELNKAWKNRDYKKVIHYLNSIKSDLSKSEQKKLNYSKKKIK